MPLDSRLQTFIWKWSSQYGEAHHLWKNCWCRHTGQPRIFQGDLTWKEFKFLLKFLALSFFLSIILAAIRVVVVKAQAWSLAMGKLVCLESEGSGSDLIKLLVAIVVALVLLTICKPTPKYCLVAVHHRFRWGFYILHRLLLSQFFCIVYVCSVTIYDRICIQ